MKRHNDKGIKDLVSSFIDAYNLRPKYVEYQIRTYWKEEMSPMVNRYTTDLKVKKHILYIQVSSAAVKHDLFTQREQIKKLINDHLDDSFIREVVIK